MNSRTDSGLAAVALSTVTGERDAERLLLALQGGMAQSDLVGESLALVLAHDDPARLRGWARAIQKQLERAAG